MTLTPVSVFILFMLTVTMSLSTYRIFKGPGLPDRVVALDLLTTVAIALSAVYAMATNQPAFIDVAMILAIIAFLGTIGFARFIDLSK